MPRRLGNWITAFAKFQEDSESPAQYNLWSAISAISASLKRNVFIQYGNYKIYPSQYIILVGPPAVGKGTAINPAVELAADANTVNYLYDRITAEKIIEKLAQGFTMVSAVAGTSGFVPIKDSSATIISPELPVFLGSSEWLLQLMCDLWDRNEFEYDTKTKGTFKVKDLSLGLLGGCVPEYIRKLNKDATSAVTGGFTSRCIFVYATEKSKRVTWPVCHKGTPLETDLIEDLRHFSTLRGEFKFTDKAKKYFDVFYQSMKLDPFESEVVINFKGRMKSHVFKTAMALCVAERDDLIIREQDLANSVKLVEAIRDNLDITFRSVGESPLAAAQDRILKYIEHKGFATKSEILKANYRHITAEDLDRVLFVLSSAGRVIEDFRGKTQVFIDARKPYLNKQATGGTGGNTGGTVN